MGFCSSAFLKAGFLHGPCPLMRLSVVAFSLIGLLESEHYSLPHMMISKVHSRTFNPSLIIESCIPCRLSAREFVKGLILRSQNETSIDISEKAETLLHSWGNDWVKTAASMALRGDALLRR